MEASEIGTVTANKQALKIEQVDYKSSPNHPDIISSYAGSACYEKGEYDLAIEHYSNALKIKQVAYERSPNQPSIAAS